MNEIDLRSIERCDTDLIIAGSGIAGLYAALNINRSLQVVILTKQELMDGSTAMAQGGVAAAWGETDNPELHAVDTLRAGSYVGDRQAVELLTQEAAGHIRQLIDWGVPFDQDHDCLALAMEGGHSRHRVIRAGGDATGKLIVQVLAQRLRKRDNVACLPYSLAIDLLQDAHGRCAGVLTMEQGHLKAYIAPAVLLATGGAGQVYRDTTNPPVSTGDGIAMAHRAGAIIKDMEFVQFHPTAFCHPLNRSFLISEAVRGEGALLKDARGKRFMPDYDPQGELAPRDIVARAIYYVMQAQGTDHVYLDATGMGQDFIRRRFPTIFDMCRQYGLNMAHDHIPVAPAAHYLMGGIAVDSDGKTLLEGLYACGECACTGVHGANRLASNSLLEGLVFGARTAQCINSASHRLTRPGKIARIAVPLSKNESSALPVQEMAMKLRGIMSDQAGVVRNGSDLQQAGQVIEQMLSACCATGVNSDAGIEFFNMLEVAQLIVKAAFARKKSIGCHYREDGV